MNRNETVKTVPGAFSLHDEQLAQLKAENEALKSRLASKIDYVREKTNQLLAVMGTASLRPDELDDETLLELDPIGIVCESFRQVLNNLHRLNDQLRESEERWRTIFATVEAGLLIISVDEQRVVDVNPAAATMLGSSREELLGCFCSDFICQSGPGNCPIIHQGQEMDHAERIMLRQDGTHLPVIKTVSKMRLNGRDHLVEAMIDISERKLAEEALAEEKERLAVTLASIGDAVITTDTEGRVMLMNRVAEQLTGWSQADALCCPVAEVMDLCDSSGAVCSNPVEKVLSTQGIVIMDRPFRLVNRDSTVRWIADSGAPIFDRSGAIIGTVLVFRDITEQQKLEEDLLRAKKLESVGLLAGGIAHDFNNLLTGIMGNISLARQMVEPASQARERLKAAEEASRRAHDLIQQLLTFSKKGSPVRQTASVAALIFDAAHFVQMPPGVTCRFAIPPDLWSADVDVVQMGQVIQNLILNASQAMPDGGEVTVAAANRHRVRGSSRGAPPGRWVEVSVADTGIGIGADALEHIFDPYFTTKEKGTGLGLAIAYSIVSKHGGTIIVDSMPGKGTTFRILLPASSEAASALQQGAAATLAGGRGRILLMDDDAVVCDVAASILTHLGYGVDVVADGSEALELYRREMGGAAPFNAVIMDLTIPGGMGGREAIRYLLEIDPGVKAIVSSGNCHDPVLVQYRQHGFQAAIMKPYRFEDFDRTLKEVLQAGAC
jgi:PAS domain S-box-containing protein